MKSLGIRASLLTIVGISAKSISGHPLLQAAAVSAARTARFQPVLVDNKPVKGSGIIKYDFVLE